MSNQVKDEKYIVRSSKPTFEYPNIPVAQYIAEQIEQYDPTVPAIIDPNTSTQITLGDLHTQSQQFASALLSHGVTRTDFVIFYAENSIQYVTALLGTIYLGLPFCTVPPTSGPFELTQQIKGSSGTILVFGSNKIGTIEKACNEPKYAQTMKQLKVMVQLESGEVDLVKHLVLSGTIIASFDSLLKLTTSTLISIPHFPILDTKQTHFCLCFTSGTSGPPKGAIHSNSSFLAMLINFEMGTKGQGEHVIQWHPIGHMSGMLVLLYSIPSGKTVVLHKNDDLEQLLTSVEKYKLVYFFMSASHASQLLSTDYKQKYDLSSLKIISHAGSKLAPNLIQALMKQYGIIILEVYAATECMAAVGDRKWPDWMVNFEIGNLGSVKPNVELKIADLTTGSALPPGENGEICFRGEACFIGYLDNPEATRSTIDPDGWYHSGDIGCVNEAGELFFVDRIKEMIKYKLYSVIPVEIENFLYTHEAVEAVCVVGVPSREDGELVRAYVQVKQGHVVAEKELIELVAQNMGSQKQLRGGVQFVPEMPRTLIGKVDRKYFKNLVKSELI